MCFNALSKTGITREAVQRMFGKTLPQTPTSPVQTAPATSVAQAPVSSPDGAATGLAGIADKAKRVQKSSFKFGSLGSGY